MGVHDQDGTFEAQSCSSSSLERDNQVSEIERNIEHENFSVLVCQCRATQNIFDFFPIQSIKQTTEHEEAPHPDLIGLLTAHRSGRLFIGGE